MPEKFNNSFKLNETQLEQLKQIIPEAFKDGFVDIGALSDALSDYSGADVLEADEHLYGLYWPGKKAARKMAQTKPKGSLVPVPGDGVDEETTRNIYIEGENLEVLKLLKKAYEGRIKMIYIDPPYNTGNDFIYDDNFTETVEEFQIRMGIVNKEGVKQTTNNKADGRFHSKWLSMMYPRLRLARDLLSDDGVIFISIDDNEVAQLRKICDEIFGDDGFVACFPWRKRTAKSDVPFGVSQDFEWIICYANSEKSKVAIEGGTRRYYETDDLPGRPWRIHDLTTQRSSAERPNSFFTMVNPKNGNEYPANPQRTWAMTEDTFPKYYSENRVVFPGDYNFLNISKPSFRYFKDDDIKKADGAFGYIAVSTLLPEDIGRSEDGTKEISELFGKKIFNYPKPVNLIKYLVKIVTAFDKNAIILDFFSGSSTTAQAVMQLNAEEDNSNLKFIMTQLPEKCEENSDAFRSRFKNICEIAKERIRLAGKKIEQEAGLNAANLDTGFKVFRLSQSNFKPAEPYTGSDIKEIPDWFSGDPLIEDWKPENLIIEVMLKEGFPLDSSIKNLDAYKKNKIYEVTHDFCGHSLVICLDTNIDNETISSLELGDSNIFICLDSAITDQAKARLDDKKGRLVVI